MKSWLSLLLAILAPVALFAATENAAPTPKPADAKKADTTKKTDASKAASEDKKEDSILAGIPGGQTYYGVRIPNYSPSGKLLMLFDAKSAKRIKDRDIEMEDLKMEIHNNDGSTFHVQMQHSVFNLDSRILESDTRTSIRRDDFTIDGDRAQFHVKEKFGRVFGNVKMVIFNTGNTK